MRAATPEALPALPPPPSLASLPAPPPGRSGWPWTEAPPALPPRRDDGSPWPRISIVTGSHNQGAYLEETLRSVLLQGYPELEYIVVDGGSSDGSLAIVRRYAPWLARWEAQPDRGQAAALNSGFAHASGEILAYLNSDDTYLPGALACIAREVDARRGRHLVTGRCLFVDEAGTALGREHTSRAVGHWRQLAVWKGNTLPQPSTFWSRAAWDFGGPLARDAGEPWIDYGLFCRMTRRYRVHAVDRPLATYRLHAVSITVSTAAGDMRMGAERISRLYWGPPWAPRHIVLAALRALHDRPGRARAAALRARELRVAGRRWRGLEKAAATALWAPDLFGRLAVERLAARTRFLLQAFATRRRGKPGGGDGAGGGAAGAFGEARGERAAVWHDGWVGPLLRADLVAAGGERGLRLTGAAVRCYLGAPLSLRVWMDGAAAARATIAGDGPFEIAVSLPSPAAAGPHRLEIDAAPYFVPETILGNGDRRQLCWRFGTLEWNA